MRSKRSLLVGVTLLWSGAGFADCFDDGTGGVGYCVGSIHNLSINEEKISFILSGGVDGLPCTQAPGYPDAPGWWRIQRTDPMYREWYGLLTTAKAVGASLVVTSRPAQESAGVCQIDRISWPN